MNSVWQPVMNDYTIIEQIGKGSFGKVIKAKCKNTGKEVAIKLIENIFNEANHARHVLRELHLMHELTNIPGNIFTTKLLDIVLPITENSGSNKFKDIFIVMDYVQQDLVKLFTTNRPDEFTEDHVVCIMYNALCALNFLDTANVIHRDLKCENILISEKNGIKICDFGYARTLPCEIDDH